MENKITINNKEKKEESYPLGSLWESSSEGVFFLAYVGSHAGVAMCGLINLKHGWGLYNGITECGDHNYIKQSEWNKLTNKNNFKRIHSVTIESEDK